MGGYDTRAYRLPAAKYFEVDRPIVQNVKRQRLAALGLTGATLVSCDFEKTSVDECLESGGVKRNKRTFFVWEGVVMYLTEDAIKATLSTISRFPGCRAIITYANKKYFWSDPDAVLSIQNVAFFGEPWKHGWKPEEIPAFMEPFGLHVIEDF